MSFVETTQKMADEVAEAADLAYDEAHRVYMATASSEVERIAKLAMTLAANLQLLARCVARRFPEQVEADRKVQEAVAAMGAPSEKERP